MIQTVEEPVSDIQARCRHCEAALNGPYCMQCGQKARERLSMKAVAAWIAGAFSLEKGVLHTTLALIKRPWVVVQSYIDGHTLPFSNPVRYYLIMMTIWQLIALWTGGIGDFAEGFAEGIEDAEVAGILAERISTYFVVGLVGLVVFWTGLSRLVFFRSRLNLAEHAVLHLYLFGLFALYQCILFIFVRIGLSLGDPASYVMTAVSLLLLAFWFIQLVQTTRRTVHYTWWQAIAGCLVVVLVGLALYVVALAGTIYLLFAPA